MDRSLACGKRVDSTPRGIAPISEPCPRTKSYSAAATIEPCLPRKAKVPPSGPDWLHEIKHDGFRILARKDGDQVKLITRNGYDFADCCRLIVDAIANLSVKSCIIDDK